MRQGTRHGIGEGGRMEPGPSVGSFAGGEESHELLFSWFEGETARPIEDDDFIADRLGEPDRHARSRLSWRARRRHPRTA
jgi:hypothetical protein